MLQSKGFAFLSPFLFETCNCSYLWNYLLHMGCSSARLLSANKSNDLRSMWWLSVILLYFFIKLFMLTTSALHECMYVVFISVICRFQFLYGLISNCNTIPLETHGHVDIQNWIQNDDTVNS